MQKRSKQDAGAIPATMESLEQRILMDGARQLEAGVYVYDGGAPLSVAVMSAPNVVDFNSDGKKDLLIGQFTQGKVCLYLNQGADASPVFNGGTKVKSSGVDITTSYG